MFSGWKGIALVGSAFAILVFTAPILWSVGADDCRCLRGPSTKGNMHEVQLAVENYALDHDDHYPTSGLALERVLAPMHLQNGFTREPLVVIVRKDTLAARRGHRPGTIFVCRPDSARYVIRGVGKNGELMAMRLTNLP